MRAPFPLPSYRSVFTSKRGEVQIDGVRAKVLADEHIAMPHEVIQDRLSNLGVSLDAARRELQRLVPYRQETAATGGGVPQTPRAKKVIEYALEGPRAQT